MGANGVSAVLISADLEAGIKRVPSIIKIVAQAKTKPNPIRSHKSLLFTLKGLLNAKLKAIWISAETMVDKTIGRPGYIRKITTKMAIPMAIHIARKSPIKLMDPKDPLTIIQTPINAIVAPMSVLTVYFSTTEVFRSRSKH